MQHTKNIYLVSYDNRKDLWLQNNHLVKTRKHLAQLIKPRNYELPISFLRFLPSFYGIIMICIHMILCILDLDTILAQNLEFYFSNFNV